MRGELGFGIVSADAPYIMLPSMRLRLPIMLLAVFVVVATMPTDAANAPSPSLRAGVANGGNHAAECVGAGESDVPVESPDDHEPERPAGIPLVRQFIPDSHAGGTRVPLNARHMLRLPGLTEMPGLHNHGLGAWLEWQMTQARLAASSMGVVALPIHPHAPPVCP